MNPEHWGEEITSRAVIARTNLGLLMKAIEYVTEKKEVKKLFFEGNFNSYTYANEGASLYDVLNLFNRKRHLIRDALIRSMKDMAELEDYIEKTEDTELGIMVEIVREYGNDIPDILKAIKARHTENDDKEQAEMIFSTVHRCKGSEYDAVQIVNDFITEEKLQKFISDFKENELLYNKLNEEINLLYVAITRAKHLLYIPDTLIPEGFPASKHIKVIRVPDEADEESRSSVNTDWNGIPEEQKVYSVKEIRKKHRAAYAIWTPELDDELTVLFCKGMKVKELAEHFGRTAGAIQSRIKKLELRETYL